MATTPPKPSKEPTSFFADNDSPSSDGASSASTSGFVLATIAPMPEDMCRNAM